MANVLRQRSRLCVAAKLVNLACSALPALVAVAGLAQQPSIAVFELAHTPLMATEVGRTELKYLVSCALPQGQVVKFSHAGKAYELPGAMGLAPGWLKTRMSADDERRVSACVFARTNFFGVPVMLSMRSEAERQAEALGPAPAASAPRTETVPAALQADAAERAEFSRFEASYFGNMFAAKPVAYVCGPTVGKPGTEAWQAHANWLTSHERVCTLPSAKRDGLTRCGFVHVGECTPANLRQAGVHYHDSAVAVFLPAAHRAAAAAKRPVRAP